MGKLSTPNSVQKLQMALHAKAKAEADYRFYALYDKIFREDILARAYGCPNWPPYMDASSARRTAGCSPDPAALTQRKA